MKPKDLSARISDLESLLDHFSFEELTMEEAAYLKSTFNAFKKSLENDSLNGDKERQEIPKQTKKEILPALEYLRDCSQLLSKGQLTEEQRSYINGMQQISRMLFEKVQELAPSIAPFGTKNAGKALDFNLHHLLRNVLYINKTLTTSPELRISIDIDRGIQEIQKGNPSLLGQMLMHLFGKGIRFMEKGSIALRISLIEETKDISLLEFGLQFRAHDSQNKGSRFLAQIPELQFRPFQKWMGKHQLETEFTTVSESEQQIKFVLPFQKSDHSSPKPDVIQNKLPTVAIVQVPTLQTGNWDSLLLACNGDLRTLEQQLNLWQGQLLGYVGKAKVQLKNSDFTGLQKSSIEIRNSLVDIPFHDIPSLLERISRTCATDRDLGHLRFLYNSLLEEYGKMDAAVVSKLKRLEKDGGLGI